MTKPTLKVLLAGGGTAGHVNPLLAVAAQLQKRGHQVAALGTAQGLEADLVPQFGLPLYEVPRVPLPRRPNLDLMRLPANLRRAVKKATAAITDFEADVVMGFGGYVSTPAYIAAKRLGIPVVIHEQNARPGLANRLGARWAQVVALTFPTTKLSAKVGTTAVTGLPLRPEIVALLDANHRAQMRRQALEEYGFSPDLPTLLVTGGSLGALHLNQVVSRNADALDPQIQVLHLSGKGKDEEVISAVRGRKNYVVLDYLVQMERALAVADFVICRSGAGTVSELTALGIPACYVPFPIGNGEQRLNAAEVVDAQGSWLCLNKNFDRSWIIKINSLLMDPKKLAKMSEIAGRCGKLQAEVKLADLIEGCVK